LSGIAGEYLVAAELSRRGYVASLTLRNTRGIDILASNLEATKSVGIQVKTNQGSRSDWMLNQKVETQDVAKNLFFVFVALNGLGVPTFHIVPREEVVATFAKESHQQWLRTPGRGGRAHKDQPIRKFKDAPGKYKRENCAQVTSPLGTLGTCARSGRGTPSTRRSGCSAYPGHGFRVARMRSASA
jgi:hypothetical protein